MNNEFFCEDGTPVLSVTPQEMAEIDRIAVEENGPNLYQMMENAGRNLAELLLEAELAHGRIVVVAGTGGNGGGGICAARHLANHGGEVELVLTKPEGLSGVAAWQRHVFSGTSGIESSLQAAFDEKRAAPTVIVDAILGYSLSGAPRGPAREAIELINGVRSSSKSRLISLDLPSGIDPLSGNAAGVCITADQVLTLALPKTGLARTCRNQSGLEVFLGDIGIPEAVYRAVGAGRPFNGRFRLRLRLR